MNKTKVKAARVDPRVLSNKNLKVAHALDERPLERQPPVASDAPLAKVEREGLAIAAHALALQVRDQVSFDRALALARRIRAMKAKVHELTDPTCEATNKAHKAATDQRNKMLAAVDGDVAPGRLGAEAHLKDEMGAYETEQKRLHDAAVAQAEDERVRLEAEEAQRVAEETLRREAAAAARRDAQVAAANKRGDKKLAQRLAAQPLEVAPVAERPVFVAPVDVYVPSAQGVKFPDYWHAQVVSLRQLIRAVAAGTAAEGLLLANLNALNAMARALHETMNVPGVRAVKTTRPSVARAPDDAA